MNSIIESLVVAWLISMIAIFSLMASSALDLFDVDKRMIQSTIMKIFSILSLIYISETDRAYIVSVNIPLDHRIYFHSNSIEVYGDKLDKLFAEKIISALRKSDKFKIISDLKYNDKQKILTIIFDAEKLPPFYTGEEEKIVITPRVKALKIMKSGNYINITLLVEMK